MKIAFVDPERWDNDYYWLQIALTVGIGDLHLYASWDQYKAAGMNSLYNFIKICAEAMPFVCHRMLLEHNSIKNIWVEMEDDFEIDVLKKNRRAKERSRTICRGGRKDAEFFALNAGLPGMIINKFRQWARNSSTQKGR